MKKLLFLTFLFVSAAAYSQTETVTIVPAPVQMTMKQGTFSFSKSTVIIADKNISNEAKMLNVYLQKLYGFSLPVKAKESGALHNAIVFSLTKTNGEKDAYGMEVAGNKITISSDGKEGLFYGIQTLLQLLPDSNSFAGQAAWGIPQLSILDHPRFSYRGMHLDVSRHFFDVNYIKKYIDYLAFHKFNNFHWHLTDDQGWRIEIKKYPLLTSVGAYRNGTITGHAPGTGNDSLHYGGFYTQDQIREVVKYAQDRFITVIPEIEMPGHASAAIAAYPELSCFPDQPTEISAKTPWAGRREGKQVQQTFGVFPDVFVPSENTFTFLENVLDEVMQLFPSRYIHIGGDECPKIYWKRSDFCQQLIKEKNLKDEHGLQSYFIQRIEKYLNSKGRSIIGWDEILEGGLAPNATVMSWRGEEGGIAAAQQKHDVIMTPSKYVYFDYAQTKNKDSLTIGGYLPLDTVISYNPVPRELSASEAKYVLGAQANLWTEYIGNTSKLEYMIFPRMSALSEVLWSPEDRKKDFSDKLNQMYKRYRLWGANYFIEEPEMQ